MNVANFSPCLYLPDRTFGNCLITINIIGNMKEHNSDFVVIYPDFIIILLLAGLGVDDMFVIIEAWNNLSAAEKRKPLPEKVALTMKHAGVSITVTSVTDFVAFAIGASTVSLSLIS